MVLIHANTTEDAWRAAVRAVWEKGITVGTEDGDLTKEVLGLLVKIKYPTHTLDKIPDEYPFKTAASRNYIDQLMTAENKWGFEYTYGERIWRWNNKIDQIRFVVDRLAKNPLSRRAVCDIGLPEQDAKLADPPCMRLIDFKLRDYKPTADLPAVKQLNITVVFRSHDVFGASYANWVALSNLQKYVAEETAKLRGENIVLGQLHSYSVSAHIYERDFDAVKNMFKNSV